MSAFEKMPALVKGILGFHKCICNGLRSYSREITILSPDKTSQTGCLFLFSLRNVRTCSSNSDELRVGVIKKPHDRFLIIIASISSHSLKGISFWG